MLRTIAVAIVLGTASQVANGMPAGQGAFCDLYPDAPVCAGDGSPDCSYCHTNPPALNSFGTCLGDAFGGGAFAAEIEGALASVADEDCDGDGITNLEEILAGALPGDAASKPDVTNPPPAEELTCEQRNERSDYNVCGYDPVYTYRKVSQDFCGRSPSFEDMELVRQASDLEARTMIAAKLDECLDSENWIGKDGVLWRMAHYKISPLQTIKSGADQGTIPLGDYEDDYNLYVYHQMDGRDARGILLADYFVLRNDNPTIYVETPEMPVHPEAGGVTRLGANLYGDVQQWVPAERRAGMLTTLWNAVSRTMFTNLPRTTAATAMRSFLGIDIAKSQGLIKPQGFTLQDYDNKGVTAPDCAFCHDVLDAATYPFTKYNGLSFNVPGGNVDVGGLFDPETSGDPGINIPDFIPDGLVIAFIQNSKIMLPGMYKERRIEVLSEMFADTEPNLGNTPEAGFLLGQPVRNLLEWAEVAANSDEFAMHTVADYWRQLIGGNPAAPFTDEYETLWRDFRGSDNYSVEAMLHKLVQTEAYGAP